ncbi:ATP phosphoribosyltransferase regulatory subunit [Thermotalea metallivorans]|uniref:ATP phosphoribosyltransferase regulatory subunit n=1 Tax=Thermotalea metallivorans TaxID=520762 RepID=A0A140L9I9_9FIRM|nr:ATP phosphoribosyltransferase regulatory subunit [Thermotalea metallivorans]KXG77214.1 ATP phosphoribosyltransferase regulatory subunit [Thermotalea metallivorans]
MEKGIDFMPEGVADIHCNAYVAKESVMGRIKSIFRSFGYRQISTPTFEYYDSFSMVEGGMNKDEMFKLIDPSGKILVLRPDMTIPIARVAARCQKNGGYQKYSYVSNVFRMNDEQNGMRREFTQGGIEYLGNEKADADGEVIVLAVKILEECDIANFQIDLGHAGFYQGLMDEFNLSKKEGEQIRLLIENKNFAELAHQLKTFHICDALREAVLQMPYLYGKPEKVMDAAKTYVQNARMEKSLQNLERVYCILKDYGYEKYISIDLGMIGHMDYYTGVIFKGYIMNYGKAILRGGRYDQLTKYYGCSMPATGFGINIDALMEVLEMYNMKKAPSCYTDYLVLYKDANRVKALRLASELREQGFIVECDVVENDLKRHIGNASYRDIKEIIEVREDALKIINLRNNEIYGSTVPEFFKNLGMGEAYISIH